MLLSPYPNGQCLRPIQFENYRTRKLFLYDLLTPRNLELLFEVLVVEFSPTCCRLLLSSQPVFITGTGSLLRLLTDFAPWRSPSALHFWVLIPKITSFSVIIAISCVLLFSLLALLSTLFPSIELNLMHYVGGVYRRVLVLALLCFCTYC